MCKTCNMEMLEGGIYCFDCAEENYFNFVEAEATGN